MVSPQVGLDGKRAGDFELLGTALFLGLGDADGESLGSRSVGKGLAQNGQHKGVVQRHLVLQLVLDVVVELALPERESKKKRSYKKKEKEKKKNSRKLC